MSIQIFAKAAFWVSVALVLWGTLNTSSDLPDWLPYQDKLMHAGAFATLTGTALIGYPTRLPAIILGLLIFGVGIEIVQTAVPGRSAEFADFLADLLGMIIGYFANKPFQRWLEEIASHSKQIWNLVRPLRLTVFCCLLAVGCWLLAVGCWLLAVGCGCWLLAVGCWLLAVGCWLLAVGCWLLAVGCWLLSEYRPHTAAPNKRCAN